MQVLNHLYDIQAVISNEFRVFRHNKASIVLSLLILPLFFTSALGGASGRAGAHFSPIAHLPIAFIDNDLSVASGRLYRVLASSGDFNNLVQGYREENAIATLGTGRIYAAIIIPQGFQEKLVRNQSSSIICYVDDGEPGLSNQLIPALQKNVQEFNPLLDIQPVSEGGLTSITILQKGTIYSGFAVGLTVILGLVVIFATFYEIAGGMSHEREEGTYARLLVSPISLGAIMIGKTLFDLILNLIRTFIVLGFATYVYGAQLNTDLGTLLAIVLLISLLTMGFGFLISSLGSGVRTVVIIEFFLVLFLFAFSGFIIDRELMRGVSKTVAYLLPWSYGIEVLRRTTLVGQSLWILTYQLQIIGIGIIIFYVAAYVLLALSRERLAF